MNRKTLVLVLAMMLGGLSSTATAQLYGGYGSFYGGYARVLRVGYLDPAFGYRPPYGYYHYGHYHVYPAWHLHHGRYCH